MKIKISKFSVEKMWHFYLACDETKVTTEHCFQLMLFLQKTVPEIVPVLGQKHSRDGWFCISAITKFTNLVCEIATASTSVLEMFVKARTELDIHNNIRAVLSKIPDGIGITAFYMSQSARDALQTEMLKFVENFEK